MVTQVELESKIKGLEFIIEHFQERVDSAVLISKEKEADGIAMSDFESGMRFQAEFLQKAFVGIIEHGALLEKELHRINELK